MRLRLLGGCHPAGWEEGLTGLAGALEWCGWVRFFLLRLRAIACDGSVGVRSSARGLEGKEQGRRHGCAHPRLYPRCTPSRHCQSKIQ